MHAEQKYPLPARERRLLVQNLLANGLIFLVLGGLLSSLAVGVSTGDWPGAFGRRALYDFANLLIERRRMTREPDYFGGKVPDNVMSEIVDSKGE